MNQPLQNADYSGFTGQVASAEQRNRVLRNTYWLLALSMVPTVLGAWIGVGAALLAALSNNTLASKTPVVMMMIVLVLAYNSNGVGSPAEPSGTPRR